MIGGDQFIAEQLGPRLGADEAIEHTAYLETDSGTGIMGALRRNAYWAGLSPTRLFLIEAGVGAFKPLLENNGVEVIDRSEISGVLVRGGSCSLTLADGRSFAFMVNRAPTHASGQAGFFDELMARHAAAPELEHAIVRESKKKMLLGLVGGLAVAGFYGYQMFYGGRAEVSVQCNASKAGAQCTASHVSGAAKAKACWRVEIRCLNRTTTAGNACVDIDAEQTRAVSLAPRDLPGLDRCDEVVSGEVQSLRIEEP